MLIFECLHLASKFDKYFVRLRESSRDLCETETLPYLDSAWLVCFGFCQQKPENDKRRKSEIILC